MALGGVQSTVAHAKIEKGMEGDALKTLAEGLKGPYLQAAGKGRLVLLLGSHAGVAKPKEILDAFQNALGKEAPLFGPGSTADAHFFQGALRKSRSRRSCWAGNFTVYFAMEESALTNEMILESAGKAMASAIGEKKDDIAAILVASFEKRGHSMEATKRERPRSPGSRRPPRRPRHPCSSSGTTDPRSRFRKPANPRWSGRITSRSA
jgi:hypothetical protein